MAHEITPSMTGLPYRNSAGICLFNKCGQVFIAERSDNRGSWQMPQGGIQKGEDPDIAVVREMKEEIGTDNVVLLGKVPERLRYEFPDYLRNNREIFRGKYRGQEQIWYAFRFLGEDAEINLSTAHNGEPAEFVDWRWAEVQEVLSLIVEFKKPVYEAVMSHFKPLADAIRKGGA